jgi:hypothetical protein
MDVDQSHYDDLRGKLHGLVVGLGSVLTASEASAVTDFLGVGEYGLALMTLADIIVEEGKQIPAEEYESIMELARQMRMHGEINPALPTRVSPS